MHDVALGSGNRKLCCNGVDAMLINDKMAMMINIVVTKTQMFIVFAMGMSKVTGGSGQAGWSVQHSAGDV